MTSEKLDRILEEADKRGSSYHSRNFIVYRRKKLKNDETPYYVKMGKTFKDFDNICGLINIYYNFKKTKAV